MAVESDFAATLLDNLKLEDPWLPPSSWESIPSESGPRFPRSAPSSDHRPLRRDSSVSEASLVRLAMNALQGVQSALISIEKISTAFCADPADRTFHQIPSLWNRASSTHAQGKILKSLGCSGFLVFLLRRFVDYFRNSNMDDSFLRMRQHKKPELAEVQDLHDGKVQQEEHPPYSIVNHAFSVAVGKIIEGYMCALDTLYASVCLRHSSESAHIPLEVCSSVGCLTTVVHSEITLLELYLHTKEVRTQIEALGNICNLCPVAFCFTESSFEDLIAKAMLEFHNFFRGGDLLTYLHAQLQVADPPHRAVLKFLFLRSFEPYYGFIRSWIYKAEISDPYKEFMVERVDNFPSHHHGKADTSLDFQLASIKERDGVAIPCFLKDYLIPIVRAGQQLQVLMKLLEFCICVASKDLTYEDLLPCWNGFSSDQPAYAFPVTFKKEEIEARALARDSYYKRMQEKLESLMTKLEFRYQQVVSHDITPNGFGHGLKSSNDLAFFKLDKSLVRPSAEDKSGLQLKRLA